jgi:translation initiation factor 5B
MIRQPIISVLGHVDHGKTSLLDRIRNTAVADKEAGRITQHIGASEVPISVINSIAGPLLGKFGFKIDLPGLLFIDTPGHAAFTNLRKRGGSVADLAILVVDVTKNLEPQTYEAINILKEYRTPFVIAANKIDLLTGWRNTEQNSFSEAIAKQQGMVVENLEKNVYALIGKLSELNFNAERFDRVTNFQNEVVIVPVSAKTGEGIAELLVYVTGLSQKFLEARLNIEVTGPGKGSILEKKEEIGLGTTIDVILYNGSLKVNETVAFATREGVGTAKVKALLKPKALYGTTESRGKLAYVDSVSAASGVKVSGTGLDNALPGSLLISTSVPGYEKEIKAEIEEVFAVDAAGVVLKSDTIGTLEAISRLMHDAGFRISKKDLGNVTKRDVLDAFGMMAVDPYAAVVLAFGVAVEEEAEQECITTGIKVINGSIIYRIIDDYKEWVEHQRAREQELAEKALSFPGQARVLPNHCFRISNPAVFGVEVLYGRIKPGYMLMNQNGTVLGKVREVQDAGASLQEAKKGDDVAISMDGITFGRQIKSNDMLYTHINDEDAKLLKGRFAHLLNSEETELLNKVGEIKKLARTSM